MPEARWGVLCDLDGTLVDTERSWREVVVAVARGRGHEAGAALLGAVEGATLEQTSEALVAGLRIAEPADVIARDLEARLETELARGVAWREGAAALLGELARARVPLALVTSSRRRWVEIIGTTVDLRVFDHIVTADDVANPKPHPEPYLLAAGRLGLSPGACIVLEDSEIGARSAELAGCRVVRVDEPATLAGLSVAELRTRLAESA